MPDPLDYTKPCPGCQQPIGEHTIAGYGDCLKAAGFNYTLPYEDIPDGPLIFPGIEGHVAGEVTVGGGFIDSAMGRVPVLQFRFTGPGAAPMERRTLPPITLVLDANGLKTFRQLVATNVDKAILAARRGR